MPRFGGPTYESVLFLRPRQIRDLQANRRSSSLRRTEKAKLIVNNHPNHSNHQFYFCLEFRSSDALDTHTEAERRPIEIKKFVKRFRMFVRLQQEYCEQLPGIGRIQVFRCSKSKLSLYFETDCNSTFLCPST